MTGTDLSTIPIVDLVAELVAREGVVVAHAATVDVVIIPRRFP